MSGAHFRPGDRHYLSPGHLKTGRPPGLVSIQWSFLRCERPKLASLLCRGPPQGSLQRATTQLTALQQVLNDLHVLQREGHAAAHVHGLEHLVDRLL
jgi:hypothetical protein